MLASEITREFVINEMMATTRWSQEAATLAVDYLLGTGQWSADQILMGVKCDFHCVYCQRDLLASVNDYKLWEKEHIVPKYKGGPDTIDNLAVACRICNTCLKSRWDPRLAAGDQAGREALIEAVGRYLTQQRSRVEEDLRVIRSHFRDSAV